MLISQNLTLWCAALTAIVAGSTALGQTTITGSSLALNSTPFSTSLSSPGYLGTFIEVPDGGDGGSTINLTLSASRGASGTGVDPHMNLVIADSKFGFTISNTSATDYSSGNVWMPAGTYVVRAERDYSTTASTYAATVNSLTVTGATVSNSTNAATLDANSLSAANTYIQNFRKGSATVELPGIAPGTQVQVDLARHAFNFGNAVPGSLVNLVNNYMGSNGSLQQTNYQAKLKQNFNAIVPENAGKWIYNLVGLSGYEMSHVDQIFSFAEANNMRVRMHNMIWRDQQPGVINSLLTQAVDDPGPEDDAEAATAKSLLRTKISERIDYYVGTGSAGDRANKYVEIDVYNESYHTGSNSGMANTYWNIYGTEGIAEIYKEVADAVAASGATAKLFVNEYSVLESNDYARWYMQHITNLRNAGVTAGYGDVLGGIGTQDHTSINIPRNFMRTMQNLSTQGLPIALTEFSVPAGATQTGAANILDQALRLTFGTADATGFFMWGFQNEGNNLFNPGAALYTVSPTDWTTWTITEAGKRWQDMLGIQDWDENPDNGWTTHVTTTVNPDGTIDFNGFYGDYELTIGGQQYALTFNKGTSQYELTVLSNTGDFDDDNDVDARDIDILWSIVRGTGTDPGNNDTADLNGDSFVNEDDVDTMLASKLTAGPNIRYGDVNLSGGAPELTDYNLWRTGTGGWAGGDFDGSGGTPELNDYNLWRTGPTQFPGTVGPHGGGSGAPLVPEPATIVLMAFALPALIVAARRGNR